MVRRIVLDLTYLVRCSASELYSTNHRDHCMDQSNLDFLSLRFYVDDINLIDTPRRLANAAEYVKKSLRLPILEN